MNTEDNRCTTPENQPIERPNAPAPVRRQPVVLLPNPNAAPFLPGQFLALTQALNQPSAFPPAGPS